ncbi:hypothetical protein OROHE_022357 [Orobanche hederae]
MPVVVELPGLPPLDLADMSSYIYVPGSYPAYFQFLLSPFVNVEKADFVLVNTFYALEAEVTIWLGRLFTFFNHTIFVKRVGCSICLRQFDSQEIERIHPFDSPKPFRLKSYAVELLKMDGYEWSAPFSVDTEGTMLILLKSESKLDQTNLRVGVRSTTKSSRYEVIFRPNFFSSSYRATMAVVDETVQLICCLWESTLALESDVTRRFRSSPDEIPQYAEIRSLVNFSIGDRYAVLDDDSVKEHICCPTCHMLIGYRINMLRISAYCGISLGED